jgi:hypothetical protein
MISFMCIINPHDTQNDVDQDDHGDQGSNAQGASFIAPPTAPSAQVVTNDGEQKGGNKRARDTIVTPGHKVHSSRAQRMSQTDNDNQSSSNAANVPVLQSIAPKATIRKPVQDIAAPAIQSSSSIPVAEATIVTEAESTQTDLFKNIVRKYRSVHGLPLPIFVEPTTAEVLSVPTTNAHQGTPEYSYSTIGRQRSRYDYGRADVPSQDDYYGNGDAYGNPRNYYGNRNARFAIGKGKVKSNSFNARGMRNAIPKEWDADQLVIPKFETTQGIHIILYHQ